MAYEATIDQSGRLVIPKPLRDRLGLSAGTRLHITADEGTLRLSPDRPAPALREREGFLVIETGGGEGVEADHRAERERRARRLAEYATRR